MAELLTEDTVVVSASQELEVLNVDPAQVYERAKVDFNFFARLAIPQVVESDFPSFYVAIFSMLINRHEIDMGRILRFALGLPRGHAKTTFVKILIAWLIVYDRISFAIIVCANEPLAESLLADVNDILCSENMEAIYGKWEQGLVTDNSGLKKCNYHGRAVILAAKGAGSSLRGLNIKHKRPDFILCDDAQTKENDDSEAERLKFRKWLTGTLFKVIAPKGNRYIVYIGNMYSDHCILYQLAQNQSWISLITGAILEDGTPLWPELHSLDELMESFFHDEELGEADQWFAEVMNDPISSALSLITGEIPNVGDREKMHPDGVFITVDPAGFREASDDNVIAVHHVTEGAGIVAEIDAGIKDPEQIIIRTLQLALAHGASLIGVESVAYQQTLLFWMNKYMKEWGITGIEVVELRPKNRTKESRIRLFVAELYARNYFVGSQVRAAFIWQAMKYKLGVKKNKDDLLDACAYGLDVRTDYWHLITNRRELMEQHSFIRLPMHNTPF